MLFERLFVQNLGAFRGEHWLELAPTNPARPVVLLGALNGSGKTTVIEALQLALYGKRAGYGWRGVGAYAGYLGQVRNRNAVITEPTTAEVTLRMSDSRRLRVRRQWSFIKDTPREFLSVYVNDSEAPDNVLTEGWDEEIERLLPARLSELFFFDGEKIEKLADPSRSGDVLKTAIASLMGLDIVDHLRGDLEVLRNRVRQRFLPDADKERLSAVEDEGRKIKQELENVRQERSSLSLRLDRTTARLNSAKGKLQRDGGDRFHQRETIATQKAVTANALASAQNRQREIAAGALPLSLVLDELARLRAEAVKGETAKASVAGAEAIRDEWDGLLRWLEKRPRVSGAARQEIEQYVKRRLQELGEPHSEGSDSTRWPDLAANLSRLVEAELPMARAVASKTTTEEQSLAEKLFALDEQQRKLPELDQLTDMFKEVGAAEEELQGLQREFAALDEQERAWTHKLSVVGREREGLLAKTLAADDAARTANYCDRSIATLTAFRANLIERRRMQLEGFILEAFKVLLRKPDLVSALKIDPDSMAVRLYDPDGLEVSAQQLSAGERQLLAIAMLWGLARASGRPVPVVIDTPLGRLDGEHRRALVERYFPDASHQVILLSTDKEVDADFSELLDDSVAHRYLIDYSAAQKSSSFTPGYF